MEHRALASLPMYDLPEARHLTDAWWQGLARHLAAAGFRDLPPQLERTRDEEEVWASPDLLLSQTCGYPLALGGHRTLQPVLTPAYTAPGCAGTEYLSHILIADDASIEDLEELRGARLAVNSEQSNSGWRLLRKLLEPLPAPQEFLANRCLSGGHRRSIEMLRSGQADFCAVDCVSHALLARHAPGALAGTRILCATERSVGLPYVTSRLLDQDRLRPLREGVFNALEDPELDTIREELLIGGGEVVGLEAYMRMAD